MPLPRSGYVWRWVRTDARGFNEDGAAPSVGSWVACPAEFWRTDSDLLATDGDVVRLKNDAELLAENRPRRLAAVDARTAALISEGFTHAGKQFSLSLTAQANWLGVLSTGAADALTYPYPVATLGNAYHLAADAVEMATIASAAQTRKGWAVATGAALKMALNDAATLAELAAVVDTR